MNLPRLIRRRDRSPLRARSVVIAALIEGLAVGAGLFLSEARPSAPRALTIAAPPPSDASLGEPAEQPVDDVSALEEPVRPLEPPVEPPLLAEPPVVEDAPGLFEEPVPPPETLPLETPLAPSKEWLTRLRRPQPVQTEPVPLAENRPRADASSAPRPLPGHNARPPYPAQAVRLGHAGTVRLRLRLDAWGNVAGASVTGSSGSRLLDLVARKTLATWRFTGGPSVVDWQVVFRLGADVEVSERPGDR